VRCISEPYTGPFLDSTEICHGFTTTWCQIHHGGIVTNSQHVTCRIEAYCTPAHLALSRNRVLHIIQPQPRIHVATIVLPRDAESHTLETLPLPTKTRRIHPKLIQVVSRVQSRKSHDTKKVANIRFPSPNTNCAFRLWNATNASV
jgi:hypothetical protein